MGYQNFYATRLFTDIGTSDTTITVENAPTETSGRLVLEARNPTQREIISYTGVSGNNLTGVTRGIGGTTAKSHLKNALIEMNLVAEDLTELLAAFDAFTETAGDGWLPLLGTYSVSSGYNKGNNSYDLTVPSDVTALLSPGMKFKITRGTAAPTQCTDLATASSQYAGKASPTGITFTDDYTLEAWIKPETYTEMDIVSRYNGTSGFRMYLDGNGMLQGYGYNAGASERVWSNGSIPLNKWTHVAVTHDHSGNAHEVYINGILVDHDQSGTISAIVQAGDLQIGAANSTSFFNGKIAEVRIWSDIRNQLEIQDNMNQQLVGTETGLVGYWKLDGDFNDSTSNANNLTPSGSAVATDVDNPFSDTQYGIITDVSYSAPNSTVSVVTGFDNVIPNMTLNSPYYSTQNSPYGLTPDLVKTSVVRYTERELQHTKTGSESGVTADVVYVTPKVDGDITVLLDNDFGFDTTVANIKWYIYIDDVFEVSTEEVEAVAARWNSCSLSWRFPANAGQTYKIELRYDASDTYYRLRWGVRAD